MPRKYQLAELKPKSKDQANQGVKDISETHAISICWTDSTMVWTHVVCT